MKIFSAQQIRDCDKATINEQSISSLQLMERAASACADHLMLHFSQKHFVVFCGMGNNGGDGLAIARLLQTGGRKVSIYRIGYTDKMGADCQANYNKLAAAVKDINTAEDFPDITVDAILVDAIFGTGINRGLSGLAAEVVDKINELPNIKVAIDIPSGLPADELPADGDTVLKASETLSFQFYKRSFLHSEAGRYVGRLRILDIGLSESYIRNTTVQDFITNEQSINPIYKPRSEFAHKGTYGTAAIVGGSYGMMGAALMATEAAAKAGAGKVMVLIPECGCNILQTAVPEAMCLVSGTSHIVDITLPANIKAIGLGPGMGKDEQTVAALSRFLNTNELPVVVDADALNIIARDASLVDRLPKDSIITPHPKEFERIFGKTNNTLDATERARDMAVKNGIYIVLKGRYTAVLTPQGECHYNSTGNPGMATGGSGDVLTGIITGLLSQKYTSFEAALLGVYLHGLAGDFAAANLSQEAMLARDITACLGRAFKEIVMSSPTII